MCEFSLLSLPDYSTWHSATHPSAAISVDTQYLSEQFHNTPHLNYTIIQPRRIIIFKIVQLQQCADDVDPMSYAIVSMKDAFFSFQKVVIRIDRW